MNAYFFFGCFFPLLQRFMFRPKWDELFTAMNVFPFQNTQIYCVRCCSNERQTGKTTVEKEFFKK